MLKFFSLLNILLTQINYKYLFDRSIVVKKKKSLVTLHRSAKIKKSSIRFRNGSRSSIAEGVRIENSTIILEDGATLILEKGVSLNRVKINIKKGVVVIGHNSIIEPGYSLSPVVFNVTGEVHIGHHNRLRGKLKVSFGGVLTTGQYTNINEETEIRCDERIEIGDFARISYKCVIWDTNTHNNYSTEIRRDIRVSNYPLLGIEYQKPKTKPVYIGDDCWIGREAAILKGTRLSNNVIVGYRTIVSNTEIEPNTTVVSNIQNTISKTTYIDRVLQRADSDVII